MHAKEPLEILGGLSVKAFLEEYWQKKPLFVKGAFSPDISSMISADELAGLSLEQEVESRLIQELPNNQWCLEHGPFADDRFSTLPDHNWTLAVQAVDHHIPEFSQFLDKFKFIPSWRLDDIMITYATDNGSVGPHYDYYDVFLIQLAGNRSWQAGQQCDESTELLPNLPVRILENFDSSEMWDVQPGDLLYLPPGLAHHGIANGECMTLSVGFRAPSNKDLLSAYTDFQLDELLDNQRYSDPDLTPQENTGWIAPSTLQKVKQQLLSSLNSPDAIEDWFGQYVSTSKYGDPLVAADNECDGTTEDRYSIDDILLCCNENIPFQRDEASRLAFTGDSADNPTHLFINGKPVPFPPSAKPLVLLCCDQRTLSPRSLANELIETDNQEFFLSLVQQGIFYIADED